MYIYVSVVYTVTKITYPYNLQICLLWIEHAYKYKSSCEKNYISLWTTFLVSASLHGIKHIVLFDPAVNPTLICFTRSLVNSSM